MVPPRSCRHPMPAPWCPGPTAGSEEGTRQPREGGDVQRVFITWALCAATDAFRGGAMCRAVKPGLALPYSLNQSLKEPMDGSWSSGSGVGGSASHPLDVRFMVLMLLMPLPPDDDMLICAASPGGGEEVPAPPREPVREVVRDRVLPAAMAGERPKDREALRSDSVIFVGVWVSRRVDLSIVNVLAGLRLRPSLASLERVSARRRTSGSRLLKSLSLYSIRLNVFARMEELYGSLVVLPLGECCCEKLPLLLICPLKPPYAAP
mmetsp:Transcript_1341/g.3128  ORF Transcript_1341/g.3128 Transcript_1341/m.3128 type:complete len:264 (-) Transcript_1341:137-928(-)